MPDLATWGTMAAFLLFLHGTALDNTASCNQSNEC